MNIQIQTISSCNANCIFCPHSYSWFDKNPGIMSDYIYDKIINDLKNISSINKICLYLMNEPFLDKKLFDRINIVKEKLNNYSLIEISTNALLLNDENSNKLIDIFKNDNKHSIWISFHGINKETLEYNMKIPYEKTLNNIINFVNKEHNLNYKIQGIGKGINNDNISKEFTKEEYIEFWKDKIPNKNITIDYFAYGNRAENVKNVIINTPIKSKNLNCVRLYDWIHITYNGDVIICCNDYNKEIVLGNICNESINEIINGDKIKACRDILSYRNFPSNNYICSRCDMYAVGNI